MKYSFKIALPFLTLLALVLSLMGGCLPWPHTTPRSAEVWGRVLDAKTHAPIQGAKVCFVQDPPHTTYTDKDGYFHMPATRNFHLGYTEGGGWPDNKIASMVISHTNYFPVGGDWSGNVEILLKPKK